MQNIQQLNMKLKVDFKADSVFQSSILCWINDNKKNNCWPEIQRFAFSFHINYIFLIH